uniref:Uncharacterized protein n=1 Tax=Uncultured archaeon GZfos26G2 TaxID=3386331 RepID=Q649N6_UNCAG|nr:hypothetical protein GZ34H9_9 [uncultured archaeon GZfos34H9]
MKHILNDYFVILITAFRKRIHERSELITKELIRHAPFTSFGAVTGLVILALAIHFQLTTSAAYTIFYILHPIHVLLSALVTTGMYRLHGGKGWAVLLIGYTGSIGIATISDSIIPYAGEILLDLPNAGIHIGFIEKWWLINPLAFVGIAIAYFRPTTKFPHAGHVLLSTWASAFHIIMALGAVVTWTTYIVIGFFLFFSVWLPCCMSDIIFPLLFVRAGNSSDYNRG